MWRHNHDDHYGYDARARHDYDHDPPSNDHDPRSDHDDSPTYDHDPRSPTHDGSPALGPGSPDPY